MDYNKDTVYDELQDYDMTKLSKETIYSALQMATHLEKGSISPDIVLETMQDKEICLVLIYCWETYNRQDALDMITNKRLDNLIKHSGLEGCINHLEDQFVLNCTQCPEEEY